MPVSGYTRTAAHRQLARESATKHGHTMIVNGRVWRSPTYTSWQSMIARCRYPSVPSYYEPGNCRWLPRTENVAEANRRRKVAT